MRRTLAFLLVAVAAPLGSGCETIQEVAGCCIALPFGVACAAGVIAGCGTRCLEEGSSNSSDAAALVFSGDHALRLPQGGGAVAY